MFALALPAASLRWMPCCSNTPTRTCAKAISDGPLNASSPLAWRRPGRVAPHLAVERALEARQFVGGYALLVEAKGEEANSFYRHYGFRPYLDTPCSLYLPLGGLGKTTRAWLAST